MRDQGGDGGGVLSWFQLDAGVPGWVKAEFLRVNTEIEAAMHAAYRRTQAIGEPEDEVAGVIFRVLLRHLCWTAALHRMHIQYAEPRSDDEADRLLQENALPVALELRERIEDVFEAWLHGESEPRG